MRSYTSLSHLKLIEVINRKSHHWNSNLFSGKGFESDSQGRNWNHETTWNSPCKYNTQRENISSCRDFHVWFKLRFTKRKCIIGTDTKWDASRIWSSNGAKKLVRKMLGWHQLNVARELFKRALTWGCKILKISLGPANREE